MIRAVLACALLVATSPTMAMTYDVHGSVVTASGIIERDEMARFTQVVDGIEIDKIVLDSDGGYALQAWKMAQWVHAHHVTTGVAKGSGCASACAMIWASGERRTIPYNGTIGVHRCNGPTQGEIDGCIRATIALLRSDGAPDSVLEEVATTPTDDMHWLSLAELRAWKVEIK
jgi:hypothetical protein